jgi:hypothetical protein
MGKTEQSEIKLTVGLPLFERGFPRTMYFNRFCIKRQDDVRLLQFGLVVEGVLVDKFSCLISSLSLEMNKQTLLEYCTRMGHPAEDEPPVWSGFSTEQSAHLIDAVSMAGRGVEGETCFYYISHFATWREKKSGESDLTLTAQPVALLRSPVDLQKHFITLLYEKA